MTLPKELLLVFGTSADPIHQGHVQLVADAVHALEKRNIRVSEVVFMPVYRHHNIRDGVKASLPLTFEHRFDLCEIAASQLREVLDCPVSVNDLERSLVWCNNRPNFTAETMAALRATTDPKTEIGFLIGVDSFSGSNPGFGQWYRWQDLLELCALIISPRKGFEPNLDYLEQLRDLGGHMVYLDELEVAHVSSSVIRARLEAGEEPGALVGEGLISSGVAEYIKKNNLAEIWGQIDNKEIVQVITEEIVETDPLEVRIGKRLFEKKLTLGLAESCTGGLIGHLVTNVPGSSEYFIGSVVSYAYQAKVKLLGVKWETLKQFGAVSSETVLEMARGARKVFDCDLGLSVSCIAGPGGATPTKPVGTCWLALSTRDGDQSHEFHFDGSRAEVKEKLAHQALQVLWDYLETLA